MKIGAVILILIAEVVGGHKEAGISVHHIEMQNMQQCERVAEEIKTNFERKPKPFVQERNISYKCIKR